MLCDVMCCDKAWGNFCIPRRCIMVCGRNERVLRSFLGLASQAIYPTGAALLCHSQRVPTPSLLLFLDEFLARMLHIFALTVHESNELNMMKQDCRMNSDAPWCTWKHPCLGRTQWHRRHVRGMAICFGASWLDAQDAFHCACFWIHGSLHHSAVSRYNWHRCSRLRSGLRSM